MFCTKNRLWNVCLAAIVAGATLWNGGNALAANAIGTKHDNVTPSKSVGRFAWQRQSESQKRILSKPKIYRRLLKSTGWIVIRDDEGRIYTGTVWIIDVKHRLAVTCWHCVRRGSFSVYFPAKKDGVVMTDPAHYLKNEEPVSVRVVRAEQECDLALIQLGSIPQGMTQLPLAQRSPEPGEDMFSVGGKPRGSDGMWQFAKGMVRLVNMQHTPLGYRVKMVQGTDGNPGNSGGAWINDRGEVIAVCESGHSFVKVDPATFRGRVYQNLSFSVDVTVVRRFVDRAVRHLDNPTKDLTKKQVDGA